MTALQPLAEHAHLPFHFLKAKDGHPFVALWQFGEWWTCGRGAPFEEDHLRAQGVTYSHPCDPAAIIVDAGDEAQRLAVGSAIIDNPINPEASFVDRMLQRKAQVTAVLTGLAKLGARP